MVAGDKRRSVEDSSFENLPYLAKICQAAKDARDAALIALIYLSGRRINEVLGLKRSDFDITDDRITFKTLNEKVFRHKLVGRYRIERNGKYYEEIRPTFLIESESGKVLAPFLVGYLKALETDAYIFQKKRGIGPIGYKMGYRIVRTLAPELWPHLLRHWRFTQLATIYKDNPVAMHRRTFHKRFESTLQYIHAQEDLERDKRS